MGVGDQLLPKDEDFAAPDWLASTTGAATHNSPPFYFGLIPWSPTTDLDTGHSEYAACPFRSGGPMEVRPIGDLYHPTPFNPGGSIPVHMTDETEAAVTEQRGVLLREEDTFNLDAVDVKVTWSIADVGGAEQGSSNQGSGGTSPTRQGVTRLPTTNPVGAASIEESTLLFSPELNTSTGMGSGNSAINPGLISNYHGWLGNSVAVRVGGGRPEVISVTNPFGQDIHYGAKKVDGYILTAYPNAYSSGDIDMTVELWRMNYVSVTGITSNDGTLLAKQVIGGGTQGVQWDRPWFLRLSVVNSGGDPTFKAYMGTYVQAGTVSAQVQLFKDGVFTSSTISVGPSGDGAANTTTGVVTDSGSAKIATYADKTIGWTMGRDRVFSGQTYSGSSGADIREVIEGVNAVLVKNSGGTIIYNDLFKRSTAAMLLDGQPNAIRKVQGIWNLGGTDAGMFLYDLGATQNFGGGDGKLRRLLCWTDGVTDTTSPNDYVTAVYDPDPTASAGYTAGVLRQFIHLRPSTQYYNHHRQITVTGARDSTDATANTFYAGVLARGFGFGNGVSMVTWWVEYTTDGSNAQTSLKLGVGYLNALYDTELTDAYLIPVATKQVQALGAAVVTGYDMLSGTHILDALVEIIPTAPSYNAPAVYTCKFDATTIAFDTFYGSAYQDVTTLEVYDPAPAYGPYGRQEGFWFSSTAAQTTGSGAYADPQFSGWIEGAMTEDPIDEGGESIVVAGEGTASTLFSSALESVDWAFTVSYLRPKYSATFASGHKYTSPQWGTGRRLFNGSARGIDKTTMDAIVAFYNARVGIEQAFTFNFPVPTTLTTLPLTTMKAAFSTDGLTYRREAEGVYSAEIAIEELL